ncbi:hypothetical protein cypCar_00043728 [Cyprinus carpio]|nr:hypothetical protein cypCar_00043728 [Cyprinus carpio]
MYGFIIQSVVVGLGGPAFILAPGDQLCFQSKEHLDNGPGRLHAGVPLDTSYCPDLRKHLQMDLTEEEHRLKVLQIDELQREVDKTLALLEKEREDCVKAKELEQLREEQLKDKLVEEQSTVSRLQCEQQEAEHQRDLLGTRVAALNCDIQQKDCMQLTEQDEVSSRDDLQAADRSRI